MPGVKSLPPKLDPGHPPLLEVPTAEAVLSGIEGVQIIACGTSYYAGLTARYWIEAIAGLPCSVEIASDPAKRWIRWKR
ncbi:hypothetical protein G6F50_015653 [Rhizopus delemar]|uniref:SIS domain-containing protein n=1 Tax=Rhizopus delemar TaxID=936053 RepID=A0A9P6XWJ9_9FUNG|nr:hypothetical protein G6F50_015653 [Rhizopus delemar]